MGLFGDKLIENKKSVTILADFSPNVKNIVVLKSERLKFSCVDSTCLLQKVHHRAWFWSLFIIIYGWFSVHLCVKKRRIIYYLSKMRNHLKSTVGMYFFRGFHLRILRDKFFLLHFSRGLYVEPCAHCSFDNNGEGLIDKSPLMFMPFS